MALLSRTVSRPLFLIQPILPPDVKGCSLPQPEQSFTSPIRSRPCPGRLFLCADFSGTKLLFHVKTVQRVAPRRQGLAEETLGRGEVQDAVRRTPGLLGADLEPVGG